MNTASRYVVATIAALASAGLALAATAQQADGTSAVERWRADPTVILQGADVDLDDFRWVARPVLVFANSPEDPAFQDQMDLLLARPDMLSNRDIVLITDTDPAGNSDVRRKLRPRGFMLALIGKDGEIKLRKPLPWHVRELTRVVDKMPMRQREVSERPLTD